MVKTINPATGEALQEYDYMTEDEVMEIATSVQTAQKTWKSKPISERKPYFTKLAKILRDNKQEYAELMTNEMGKPISEALAEIEKCAWLADVLVEKAEEWLADEEVEGVGGEKHFLTHDPLGTLFIVMPWNYPFWQPIKVGLSPLMAGNAVILKHASNVTGSSLALEKAMKEAGFDVFRSIVADHETAENLIGSDYVQACSLTGSVGAGRKIGSQAGKSLKKTVLELGGSDPMIILNDANLEEAVKGAVKGRTSNAGQVCISSKRILVQKNIAEEFVPMFCEAMKDLKVGDPLNHENDVGPLAVEKALDEMESFVKDAVEKGAELAVGGKRIEGRGNYFEPTVLINVTKDMEAMCSEVFGPVAPVFVFETEEEAVDIANDSEFGLSSTVWTQDLEKAEAIARKIEAGNVFVNSNSTSHPLMPFGGIKDSGYGRELSHLGIKEFTNIKAINVYKK